MLMTFVYLCSGKGRAMYSNINLASKLSNAYYINLQEKSKKPASKHGYVFVQDFIDFFVPQLAVEFYYFGFFLLDL
jgi:hypothetical protein